MLICLNLFTVYSIYFELSLAYRWRVESARVLRDPFYQKRILFSRQLQVDKPLCSLGRKKSSF